MTTVLVVAKAPVAGEAKTRLIPALGAAGAADLAAAALLDTLDAAAAAAAELGTRPVVALTGDLARAERGAEVRTALAAFTVVRQRGDGFAARLVHAHADAGDGAVVQIGMDTPQVTAGLLVSCAGLLARADAALGPADDGGWWVLAVRSARMAEAVAGVPMSTDRTGALTAAALRAAGHRVARAPGLRDVDTAEDARAVARTAPGTRFAHALGGAAVR